jgi:ABC-2 type transport system permease protein
VSNFIRGFLGFSAIYFRKPKFFAIVLLLFLSMGSICYIFSQHTVTGIPVAVIDHDNSSLSRQIRLFLSAGNDLRVDESAQTIDEAKTLLRQSQIAALVYIPEDLSRRVKSQEQATIYIFEDASQYLLAKNVNKTLLNVLKTSSYGVAAIALQKRGVPKAELIPAVQPISINVERPFNALTLYSFYLVPILTFFGIYLFCVLLTCACFQVPLPNESAKPRRQKRLFYLGRLFAVYTVSVVFALILLYLIYPLLDIELKSPLAVFLPTILLFTLSTQLFASAFNVVLYHNKILAMQGCLLLTMMTLMVSGLTWPLESMPIYVRIFAHLMPATPVLHALQTVLHFNANFTHIAAYNLLLLQQCLLFFIIIAVSIAAYDMIFPKTRSTHSRALKGLKRVHGEQGEVV